jgi:hypothetical protein
VKSLVKHLASLEEIHYASHYGYTSDAEALLMDLGRELTQGLTVNILYATRQGWAGAVTHDETGVRCVLAYGHPTPMGWAGGEVICP